MIDSLQIADFDLDISEVLLVHKNTFVHLFKWSDYRAGRRIDGITYREQPLRGSARSAGFPAGELLVCGKMRE